MPKVNIPINNISFAARPTDRGGIETIIIIKTKLPDPYDTNEFVKIEIGGFSTGEEAVAYAKEHFNY